MKISGARLPDALVDWSVFYYGTMWKQIVLNLLFLLCSIPLLTMPAAFAALSGVEWKLLEGKEDEPYRQFFRLFRKLMPETMIPTLLFVCLSLVGLADIYLYLFILPLSTDMAFFLVSVPVIAIGGMFLFYTLYLSALPVSGESGSSLFSILLKNILDDVSSISVAFLVLSPILFIITATTIGIPFLSISAAASMSVIILSGVIPERSGEE